MSDVVAVLEHDGDDKVVVSAEALATLLGAGTRLFRVPEGEGQARADAVVTALGGDVEAAVLSAQVPKPVCWQVMQRVSTPLLVVPQHSAHVSTSISEVLLPLDGTQETAAGVALMTKRVVDAGARVLAMHVFDATTVPAFWDQAAHSHEHWTEEFLLRNLPSAVDLDLCHLCRGRTPEEVVAEAQRAGVDLIMIGWAQNLGEGRAQTVRHALTDGSVPVLLVPTRPGLSQSTEGPFALDSPAADEAG